MAQRVLPRGPVRRRHRPPGDRRRRLPGHLRLARRLRRQPDDSPTTSPTPTAGPPPGRRSARTAAAAGACSTSPTASPRPCAPCTRAWRPSARPPAPSTTARSAAPCCPPTPRRSTGSPTPSPTSCAPAPRPVRSPSCAGPRPTSPRSRAPSSPATSPVEWWSASPGLLHCPRSPTSSPSARSCRTQEPTPPWSTCSPDRAGAIGPRDLALLGRRARLLVAHARADAADDPDRRLAAAVEGVDPAEVISLADALDTFLEASTDESDDGLPFSPDARVRFARLAAELRDLRRSLSDPLMDVLHRVLAVTGLEVELSASPARARRPPPRDPVELPGRRRLLRRERRRGHPARLPRLPAHRRPVREGPRQRPARRREHRQGAHRAQVQGPGVGRRRRPRTGDRHLPQRPGPREVDRPGQGAAARPARRHRHPCPTSTAGTRAA